MVKKLVLVDRRADVLVDERPRRRHVLGPGLREAGELAVLAETTEAGGRTVTVVGADDATAAVTAARGSGESGSGSKFSGTGSGLGCRSGLRAPARARARSSAAGASWSSSCVVVVDVVDVEVVVGSARVATTRLAGVESPPLKSTAENDAPAIATANPTPTRALRTPTECIHIPAATAVADRSARMATR